MTGTEHHNVGSTSVDVEAYLNRYHIVLLSDAHVYFRHAASGMNCNVPRMPWPNPAKPDLFLPDVAETLRKFKKDQKWKPDDYNDDFN